MNPPPTLHVESIPEDEGLSLDLALDKEWLEGVFADAAMRVAPGSRSTARVRLDKSGRDVTLSGEVAARVVATCVACLEEVELPIRSEFQLHLSPAKPHGAAKAHEEVELSPDELDADVFTDDKIELSHWLREQLLLEAPVHPRHEGDCPAPLHLPPSTPAVREREIDPRLAPLLKLAKKE